jgi:membrane-associated phospholipid phosphatase
VLPAESAWVWYHSDQPFAPVPWHDFLAMRVRDGRLTVLDLQQLRGLVTFPSFHVAMAVMLARAAQGTRFALFSVVLNRLMIVSTPSEGGHFLVDAICSIAVAVAAIFAAHWLVGRSGQVQVAKRNTGSIAHAGWSCGMTYEDGAGPPASPDDVRCAGASMRRPNRRVVTER